MKKIGFTLFLVLFILRVSAQQQFLDTGFGNAGKQVMTLPGFDWVQTSALQSDGKILVAGVTFDGGYRPSLTRYFPDGTLDTGFGQAGNVYSLLPDSLSYTYSYGFVALAIQSDGKIIGLSDRFLIRFLPDGSLDTSGAFPVSLNDDYYYDALAVGPGDEIVVCGGTGYPVKTLVTRLLPDGTKDPDFSTGSSLIFAFGTTNNWSAAGQALSLQPDGKILVAANYLGDLAMARIGTDGVLDTSFSTDGKVVADLPTSLSFIALGLRTDGKILIACSAWGDLVYLLRFNSAGMPEDTLGSPDLDIFPGNPSGLSDAKFAPDGDLFLGFSGYDPDVKAAVVKITAEGALDTGFADGGIRYVASNFITLAIQPDLDVVVAGITTDEDFAIARYLPDGTFDPAFNNGAPVVTNFGEAQGAFHAVALQPDGTIVLVGTNVGGGGLDGLLMARYDAGGTLATEGPYDSKTSGKGWALALQPDGKIVAGGSEHITPMEGLLLRFMPDGALDSTFSSPDARPVHSLAVLPDGKILTVGVRPTSDKKSPDSIFLCRYLPDGSYDPDFGTGGIVDLGSHYNFLTLQPDGKILLASTGLFYGYVHLARYLPDGAIDTTFSYQSFISDGDLLAIQPQMDGRIKVAVYVGDGFSLVIRHLENGVVDTSFGDDGLLLLEMESTDTASVLRFMPDGKMIVAGYRAGNAPGEADFFLARFFPDGTRDTSIGLGGLVVTDFDGLHDVPNTMTIQPDGKIILAGASGDRFALARYRADLSLEAKEVYGGGFQALKLWPNPVGDKLFIELPGVAGASPELRVSDAQGRLVLGRKLPSGVPLDLGGLPPGWYVLNAFADGKAYAGRFFRQ